MRATSLTQSAVLSLPPPPSQFIRFRRVRHTHFGVDTEPDNSHKVPTNLALYCTLCSCRVSVTWSQFDVGDTAASGRSGGATKDTSPAPSRPSIYTSHSEFQHGNSLGDGAAMDDCWRFMAASGTARDPGASVACSRSVSSSAAGNLTASSYNRSF